MRGLQLTLAVIALAATVKGQAGPPCWYDSMCPFTEGDTSVNIPATETTLADKMTWCYTKCGDAEAAALGSCTFFTVFATRGGSSCKLLTSCQDADADADCLEEGTCNSGPGDCDAVSTTVCAILTASSDADIDEIPWQCDTVNPYTTPVPDGETCFLSCDGWVNRATQVQTVILSTCQNGVWEESVVSEGVQADYPALTGSLPKPDAVEADQLHCGCAAEPMGWDVAGTLIAYEPNSLPGTTFTCTGGDYITGDGETTPYEFSITPTMVCRMFCDGYHVATISCQDGSWTGEPELGAWCYAPPTAADDLNA